MDFTRAQHLDYFIALSEPNPDIKCQMTCTIVIIKILFLRKAIQWLNYHLSMINPKINWNQNDVDKATHCVVYTTRFQG